MASILSTLGDDASTHVFLHDVAALPITGGGEQIVPGLRFYDERALLLARPHDVVCVQNPVDPDYLGYLAELGIGPLAENVLVAGSDSSDATLTTSVLRCTGSLDRLVTHIASKPDVILHPFMATRAIGELAVAIQHRLGRPIRVAMGGVEIAALANRKEIVHAKALELGVPVAPGEIVWVQTNDPGPLQEAVDRWRRSAC